MDEEFVTAAELAAILKCSTEKVYRMARWGEIPSLRVGRSWRFSPSQVIAKLQEFPRGWEQSYRSRTRRRIA